jgi:hypothetical protein
MAGAAANKNLQSFFKRPSGEQYAMIAAMAAEADIGPKSNNRPLMTAAGMRFAETHDVADKELKWCAAHHRFLAPRSRGADRS